MDKLINEVINRFVLKETLANEDYPLYHMTTYGGLKQILKTNKLKAFPQQKKNDYEKGICLSRRPFVPTLCSEVTIKFHASSFNRYRGIKIYSYSWRCEGGGTKEDETEERIVSTEHDGVFALENIKDIIEEIYIYIPEFNGKYRKISFICDFIDEFGQEVKNKVYIFDNDNKKRIIDKKCCIPLEVASHYYQVMGTHKYIDKPYHDAWTKEDMLDSAVKFDIENDPILRQVSTDRIKTNYSLTFFSPQYKEYSPVYFMIRYMKQGEINRFKIAFDDYIEGLLDSGVGADHAIGDTFAKLTRGYLIYDEEGNRIITQQQYDEERDNAY